MSSEKSIFLTNRIADWRKQELNESFTKTLSRIEEFGCEIWSISADVVTPSFSYTVGIYDTCGHPEIVTIGLRQGTAHHALNEAARKARAGVDLAVGRHAGLVGDATQTDRWKSFTISRQTGMPFVSMTAHRGSDSNILSMNNLIWGRSSRHC